MLKYFRKISTFVEKRAAFDTVERRDNLIGAIRSSKRRYNWAGRYWGCSKWINVASKATA